MMLTVVCQGLIRHCGASQYALSMARDIHWVTIIVIVVIVIVINIVIFVNICHHIHPHCYHRKND